MKRWLEELARDLIRVRESPWFTLDMHEWGIAAGNRRRAIPERGEPRLLYFPAPYSALSAVAALRGWGGVRTPGVQHGIEPIILFQQAPSPLEAATEITKPLFWTPAQALLAAHLLVPWDVRGHWWNGCVVARRQELWARLGYTAAQETKARKGNYVGGRHPHPYKEFWTHVEPEIGALL